MRFVVFHRGQVRDAARPDGSLGAESVNQVASRVAPVVATVLLQVQNMTMVRLSPRFQVVIPRQIREALGLRPGQYVEALQYADRVEFIPIRPMKSMRGYLKGIKTRVPRSGDRV